jgi:nucleotide sugar dehydrogenase
MKLEKELLSGRKTLGVWGIGYIGFSSMTYFARQGVKSLGNDVIPERISEVTLGKSTVPNLDYWLGFDVEPLAKKGLMNATEDWKKLISPDIPVHLISVPTEHEGRPYHDILKTVIGKLCTYKGIEMEHPPLVIVESTLTATVADELVLPMFREIGMTPGEDILFGIAPRRDWFTAPEQNLKRIPRVVGGTTPETTQLMGDVLGIICDKIEYASDHKHAAMIKSIENTFRQVEISLGNQLSEAFPDVNMTEVLRLAGTKWNVPTVHPSFGTGGYCIPLAPQYVLAGATRPEKLTIIESALKSDQDQPYNVVNSLVERGVKNVALLGIAYTGDLKVHVLSPALKIASELQRKGVNVVVNDPYYSSKEIHDLTGCESAEFPDILRDVETVVIAAPHQEYHYTNTQEILSQSEGLKLVVDNMGIWKNMKLPDHIEYHEAGDAGWLG